MNPNLTTLGDEAAPFPTCHPETRLEGDLTDLGTMTELALPMGLVIGAQAVVDHQEEALTPKAHHPLLQSVERLLDLLQTVRPIPLIHGQWVVSSSLRLQKKNGMVATLSLAAYEEEGRWARQEMPFLKSPQTGEVLHVDLHILVSASRRLLLLGLKGSIANNSTPPTPQLGGRRKLELLPRTGSVSGTTSPLASPKLGPTPTSSSSNAARSNPFGAARYGHDHQNKWSLTCFVGPWTLPREKRKSKSDLKRTAKSTRNV